jgi:integrase
MRYKSPLLQSLQSNLRLQHLSRRTEAAYIYWTKRFVRFCGLRHPSELGPAEVRRFLTHLVVDRHLSAATQQQALGALLFLYRNVLGRSLETMGRLARGRVPTTLPVVLTPDEVARVLGLLRGTHRLVGLLLYGSGLRVTECLMLRVKDLDLERGELDCSAGQGREKQGHRYSGNGACARTPKFPRLVNRQVPAAGCVQFRGGLLVEGGGRAARRV